VLDPQASDDLFFVATGRGGHVFASSISEQARNVAAYRAFERQNRAAAGGAAQKTQSQVTGARNAR
jgi:UPF0755 protein